MSSILLPLFVRTEPRDRVTRSDNTLRLRVALMMYTRARVQFEMVERPSNRDW